MIKKQITRYLSKTKKYPNIIPLQMGIHDKNKNMVLS